MAIHDGMIHFALVICKDSVSKEAFRHSFSLLGGVVFFHTQKDEDTSINLTNRFLVNLHVGLSDAL